ncbi:MULTISPECIES: contractile injection system tape measure protein [unclassified Enterobacter]|uniref:contractile injection system tape measure protein n=1 Tax=unclassified Enterobacter TaxID=2608935 RepID=UPI0016117FB6
MHSSAGNRSPGESRDPEILLAGFDEEAAVYPLALCCLQPVRLRTLLLLRQMDRLQLLLKRMLLMALPEPSPPPPAFYRRATESRLAFAALAYLLSDTRGQRWLSEHYPDSRQLNALTEAIRDEEVPAELVVQVLESATRPGSRIPPATVIFRWLLPLWQQGTVRDAVVKRAGRTVAEHISTYFRQVLQQQSPLSRQAPSSQQTHQSPLSRQAPSSQQPQQSPLSRQALPSQQPQQSPLSRQAQQSHQPRQSPSQQPSPQSQSVSNAGLAILWPLLPQLFSLLELTREDRFIHDSARWQAAVCLDGLVWAQEQPVPSRLAVNRLLCGIAPDVPQPELSPLSPQQQQRLDDWLTAVSRQLPGWQKLGPNDIRSLFLQRPGEVVYDTVPPQIKVWPEAFDYLLGDWPWPLTMAALPWLKQPLTLFWPLPHLTG